MSALLLLLFVALAFTFWWFAWPRIIAMILHASLDPVTRQYPLIRYAREHIGTGIFVATALIGGCGVALLATIDGWNERTLLTGLGISGAVTFTYGTLLPPVCSPVIEYITNIETGAVRERHERSLSLRLGVPVPVRLVVFNTGIATWTSFRVTIDFQRGDGRPRPGPFRVCRRHPTFPNADRWQWSTGEVNQAAPTVFQLSRNVPLASGEPIVTSLIVEATEPGRHRIAFVCVCSGRFGETTTTLPVIVSE